MSLRGLAKNPVKSLPKTGSKSKNPTPITVPSRKTSYLGTSKATVPAKNAFNNQLKTGATLKDENIEKMIIKGRLKYGNRNEYVLFPVVLEHFDTAKSQTSKEGPQKMRRIRVMTTCGQCSSIKNNDGQHDRL